MSEERQIHPQEPAEGSEQDVRAPGAERADDEENVAEGASAEPRSREHPQEPAEGAEEDVGPPGAHEPDDD